MDMKVEIREEKGEVTRVRVNIGCARFDITEQFGRLNILASGELTVSPRCSNVIELEAEAEWVNS